MYKFESVVSILSNRKTLICDDYIVKLWLFPHLWLLNFGKAILASEDVRCTYVHVAKIIVCVCVSRARIFVH
jgi:hypothetical protein